MGVTALNWWVWLTKMGVAAKGFASAKCACFQAPPIWDPPVLSSSPPIYIYIYMHDHLSETDNKDSDIYMDDEDLLANGEGVPEDDIEEVEP